MMGGGISEFAKGIIGRKLVVFSFCSAERLVVWVNCRYL
jgi:hypothetical protein